MSQRLEVRSRAISASEADAQAAGKLAEQIVRGLDKGAPLTLRVGTASEGETVSLSPVVAKLVLDLLGGLARGNAVAVSALPPELTGEQAADLLNISRSALVELIEEGKLSASRVGTEILVRLEDTLAFKAELAAKRKVVLDELVAHDQALGLQ